jgi:hypothetical protein
MEMNCSLFLGKENSKFSLILKRLIKKVQKIPVEGGCRQRQQQQPQPPEQAAG